MDVGLVGIAIYFIFSLGTIPFAADVHSDATSDP
jgi:hypothetical protein